MGEKEKARQAMKKAKVPILPGSDGVLQNEEEALAWARTVGFPVILKASAGGGGRGDRDDRGVSRVKIGVRAAGAVERLREDPGDRRLARPPGADEQVGVRDPAARDRVPECSHHMVLADDVAERLWPPFARDDLIARFGQGWYRRKDEVARHSTALVERRYRCCLPALAGFARLPMHGAWPTRNMPLPAGRATPISREAAEPPGRSASSAGSGPSAG